MSDLTTGSKVQKFFEQNVISQPENRQEQLSDSDLHGLETKLSAQLIALRNHVCRVVLPVAAEQAYEGLGPVPNGMAAVKSQHAHCRCGYRPGAILNWAARMPMWLQAGYEQKRHLLAGHWCLIGSASPALYDKVGFCATLCPSYDTGHESLTKNAIC